MGEDAQLASYLALVQHAADYVESFAPSECTVCNTATDPTSVLACVTANIETDDRSLGPRFWWRYDQPTGILPAPQLLATIACQTRRLSSSAPFKRQAWSGSTFAGIVVTNFAQVFIS